MTIATDSQRAPARRRGRVVRAASGFLRELLQVELVNRVVFALRFVYFVRVRRRVVRAVDENAVIAHDYSTRMLLRGKTSSRPLRLIRPLSVIDRVPKDAKVLSVGCRFETELLYLVGYGFDPAQVRGLDMISYSPWVDVGNMHDMPYGDDEWDVVILGWVLAYSDDPRRAAKEVVRVIRDRGVVAIGLSYYPEAHLRRLEAEGTLIGSATARVQTVDEILALFEPYVGDVFFRHDAADPEAEGVCATLLEIRKT